MIAAAYCLDVYCDCEECQYRPVKANYAGKSWTECAKEARKDGWRLSKDRQRAFAPKHPIRSWK